MRQPCPHFFKSYLRISRMNHYYANFTPAVTRHSNATVTTNCVSYAYDGYKSSSVKVKYWVNSNADSNPLKNDLNTIFASGNNSDKDTISGDRCHNDSHVWKVTNGTGSCGAKTIRWKNNSSGIYSWDHGANQTNWTNDSPKGSGGSVYTTYTIYNKTAR